MTARLLDLGTMEYLACVERQLDCVSEVQAGGDSTLIFVEHPPTLTLGANFHAENLLDPTGMAVHQTERGGDVTYHGPGQLVVYPIFDLTPLGKDLHRWLRQLEETMIVTLSKFGLSGRRFAPHTGAWVGDEKVAAIGIKVKRWVSMHGIALNCNNDLAAFDAIVPCGIRGYGVTSLTSLLGREVTVNEAKPIVVQSFEEVFGVTTWV